MVEIDQVDLTTIIINNHNNGTILTVVLVETCGVGITNQVAVAMIVFNNNKEWAMAMEIVKMIIVGGTVHHESIVNHSPTDQCLSS